MSSSPPIDRIVNIRVIGARAAGKTTLIRSLLTGDKSVQLQRYDDDEYPYEEVYRTQPFEIKRKRMVIRIFEDPTSLRDHCGTIVVVRPSDEEHIQFQDSKQPTVVFVNDFADSDSQIPLSDLRLPVFRGSALKDGNEVRNAVKKLVTEIYVNDQNSCFCWKNKCEIIWFRGIF